MAIFIFVCSTFQSCKYIRMDFTGNKLKVNNQSDIELGILVNLSYPDTSIVRTQNYFVYPNDTGSVSLVNRYWDDVFNEREKVTLFFVSWDELKASEGGSKETYRVLKRYLVSKSNLDSLNWIIKYP